MLNKKNIDYIYLGLLLKTPVTLSATQNRANKTAKMLNQQIVSWSNDKKKFK